MSSRLRLRVRALFASLCALSAAAPLAAYTLFDAALPQKDLQRVLTVEECLDGSMQMLSDMSAVFLCGVHSHERNIILKYCVANGVVVYIIPRVGDVLMSSAKRIHMLHLPMLRVSLLQGTYLMWVDVSAVTDDVETFCQRLKDEHHLWIAAGSHYGTGGEGYVRINLATQRDNVIHALERLKDFIASLNTNARE